MRLNQYRTPAGEASTYKNIPIQFLDYPVIKRLKKTHHIRIKFRGPRPDSEYHTTKKNATSFAIYIDCTIEVYKRQQAIKKLAAVFAKDVVAANKALGFDSFNDQVTICKNAIGDALWNENYNNR